MRLCACCLSAFPFFLCPEDTLVCVFCLVHQQTGGVPEEGHVDGHATMSPEAEVVAALKPLPGEPGKPLQFWKHENQNCSVATWLCIMEVVLHVSRLCVEPARLLCNVFADRRKLVHGQAPYMHGVFHEFCINKCHKLSTPALHDSDKPLLPHVHCADLALFLGEGTSAWAAFSCVTLKTVPVDKVNVDAAKERLLASSPRPAIISVYPDRNETVALQMRTFLSHVVGNLPQLVHVGVEANSRLEAIEPHIVLSVPRIDMTLVPRATTVTCTLAAAACHNGSHYNAIVVGADEVHWDYDCIGSGLLIQRPRTAPTSAKPGYHFKSAKTSTLSASVTRVFEIRKLTRESAGTLMAPCRRTGVAKAR